MTFWVHECEAGSSLYQEFTASDNMDVVAIRPRLYKHNNPAGSLTVKIKDSNGYQVATSSSVAISDIHSTFGANYAHGYYRFYVAANLVSGQTYRVYLENSGYAFAEGAYVAWCTCNDLQRVSADYSPTTGLNSPLDFEIWERRKV